MDTHPEERKASPEHGSVPGRRSPSLSAAAAAVCLALLLSALATFCFTVIKTREMESRVLALERMSGGPVPEELRDSVRSLVQETLSELMPKVRMARDVNHECVCPPGPIAGRRLFSDCNSEACWNKRYDERLLALHFTAHAFSFNVNL
ncbi:hypothetical protein PDJAM_G00227150 [Pangasius djambal]|uniref:Uncharacterized protein n=1 Tax=Pangasius djambal TaxID=1691987 RepID=A0ACC5YDK3_9TELE|nr:hypothetical protein [Pangasius djambal]